MMFNSRKAFLMICLLLTLPLSGCTSSTPSQSQTLEGETLVEIQNPCTNPSEAISQSLISIMVNGDERVIRLTAPDSEAGTRLPVVLAFHGGGDAEEDFPQQTQFDQLAESEDFIMAYVVAESDRTPAEGDWFLNTAATSQDDNEFSEAIVDELSKAYCVDQNRLYAVGYSLGSMFTYEIACQLNHRFAAVTSFAGTMPVNPESCDLVGKIAVMHIHGKLDYIIYYHSDWDWKEGEHEGVGTMSEVPALIDYWADKSDCQATSEESSLFVEHIIHNDCVDDIRIEHYGLELNDHNWPNEIDGTPTYEIMWEFLSDFDREQGPSIL